MQVQSQQILKKCYNSFSHTLVFSEPRHTLYKKQSTTPTLESLHTQKIFFTIKRKYFYLYMVNKPPVIDLHNLVHFET